MPSRQGSYIGEVVRCGKTYGPDGSVVRKYWRWTGDQWVPYNRE